MRRRSTSTLAVRIALVAAVMSGIFDSIFVGISGGTAGAGRSAWAATTSKDRRFVSVKHGITVDAPAGWTLSTHTGFPNVLVLLLHPDGSRISVTVSDTQADSARALADGNRRGLDVQGLKLVAERAGARDGVEIEARAAARSETVVQLYLVRATAPSGPKQAIIISLVTPTAALATQRAALDQVVAKLGLNPLPEPAAPRGPASKTPSAAQRPAEEQGR